LRCVGEVVDAIECSILYAHFIIAFLSVLALQPSPLLHAYYNQPYLNYNMVNWKWQPWQKKKNDYGVSIKVVNSTQNYNALRPFRNHMMK